MPIFYKITDAFSLLCEKGGGNAYICYMFIFVKKTGKITSKLIIFMGSWRNEMKQWHWEISNTFLCSFDFWTIVDFSILGRKTIPQNFKRSWSVYLVRYTKENKERFLKSFGYSTSFVGTSFVGFVLWLRMSSKMLKLTQWFCC